MPSRIPARGVTAMNAWIAVVLLACIVLSAAMLVRAALRPVICPDCRVRLPRPAWRWKMPGLLERWVCPACGCQIDRKGKKYTPPDQQGQPPPVGRPNAQTKQAEARPTATDSPAREIRPDTP